MRGQSEKCRAAQKKQVCRSLSTRASSASLRSVFQALQEMLPTYVFCLTISNVVAADVPSRPNPRFCDLCQVSTQSPVACSVQKCATVDLPMFSVQTRSRLPALTLPRRTLLPAFTPARLANAGRARLVELTPCNPCAALAVPNYNSSTWPSRSLSTPYP